MQLRNPRNGKFVALSWSIWSKDKAKHRLQRLYLYVILACAVIPITYALGIKTWQIVMHELTYIAAPRAYADTFKTVKPIAEQLQEIADCESGTRNEDGSAVKGSAKQFYDDGRVVRNFNKDGTVDVGMWQINSVHMASAVKLDLDPLTEEGNKEFALWLYKHEGSQPWYSSQKCWDR